MFILEVCFIFVNFKMSVNVIYGSKYKLKVNIIMINILMSFCFCLSCMIVMEFLVVLWLLCIIFIFYNVKIILI